MFGGVCRGETCSLRQLLESRSGDVRVRLWGVWYEESWRISSLFPGILGLSCHVRTSSCILEITSSVRASNAAYSSRTRGSKRPWRLCEKKENLQYIMRHFIPHVLVPLLYWYTNLDFLVQIAKHLYACPGTSAVAAGHFFFRNALFQARACVYEG